jgi:hypothetical protein
MVRRRCLSFRSQSAISLSIDLSTLFVFRPTVKHLEYLDSHQSRHKVVHDER